MAPPLPPQGPPPTDMPPMGGGSAIFPGDMAMGGMPMQGEPDPQAVIQQLSSAEQMLQHQMAAENHNLLDVPEGAEPLLEEGLVKEIGQEVFNGFDDDEKTREQWLDDHTFWLSLYMQRDYAENSDPERDWGATESVPILTEACDQFQSRTYKTFFPQDTFISAIPMRKTKETREMLEDRAKRIGDHMSYQLGFLDRSYKEDKDALFLGVAVHGSFFTKTYFNKKLMRGKVDNVRPTDLVVNYNVGPVAIEDLRRKTHIRYTTVGETEDMVQAGFLSAAASPALQEQGRNPYNVKVDETQGLTPSSMYKIKRDAPAVLLEQHVYLDLDGSGQYKPYIATICGASRRPLRLVIGWDADDFGRPQRDYEQVQYFTHYKYKNNPDGFYGLGLGHTIGDLNSAVNIMLRQSMDAGTLANDGNMSGFISERLALEQGEDIRMILGKLRKIPDTIGDLSNAIMMMKFPGPNQSLMAIMEQLDLRAQRLGSTTEATTGASEKVIQPTTYMAQVEQALEAFSSVQMRLSNSLSTELQKLYRINQKYLPLVDYYVVNDAPAQITRADYADDMLIQPIFDPKFATQAQKVARAQAELQGTLQNPVNQGRPEVVDAAFKRYFEALDVEDIEELIPPMPQIENFDDQQVENMWFLMPKEARPLFDVFPDQNHMQHLAEMDVFVAQYAQQLQPDQMEDLLKHHMKHTAYLYGQQKGIIPPSAPTPPLAARPGNTVDANAVTSTIPPAQAKQLGEIMGGAAQAGGAAGSAGGAVPAV